MTGKGDHGPIVGAQARRWKQYARIEALLKFMADASIGAHPAGHHQIFQAGLGDSARHLDSQRVGDSHLETRGNIGGALLIKRRTLADLVPKRGLQSAETEIKPRPIDHGARKPERLGITTERELRDGGAAREPQPQQTRHLVESFAHGIIKRLSEQSVFANGIDAEDLCVSAGDQQRKEGQVGLLIAQEGCQQVALHVMHTD